MNVAQPREETRLPGTERGNEALPSLPSNEHRFEDQPQERVERSAPPVSVVHEQPVEVPVQTPSVAPVVIQAEPHPVGPEPKNQ
jgi:hypothetical protein